MKILNVVYPLALTAVGLYGFFTGWPGSFNWMFPIIFLCLVVLISLNFKEREYLSGLLFSFVLAFFVTFCLVYGKEIVLWSMCPWGAVEGFCSHYTLADLTKRGLILPVLITSLGFMVWGFVLMLRRKFIWGTTLVVAGIAVGIGAFLFILGWGK